jgi:hypothetical protein
VRRKLNRMSSRLLSGRLRVRIPGDAHGAVGKSDKAAGLSIRCLRVRIPSALPVQAPSRSCGAGSARLSVEQETAGSNPATTAWPRARFSPVRATACKADRSSGFNSRPRLQQPVAQRTEQPSHERHAAGSNPARLTPTASHAVQLPEEKGTPGNGPGCLSEKRDQCDTAPRASMMPWP